MMSSAAARGDDEMWGGAGADTFVYAPGDGNDKIEDFTGRGRLD